MKAIRLVVGIWLLFTATQLCAEPVTLTFSELTARPVNGVVIAGLTFSSTINGKTSDQAVYGASLPGSTTNVSPPALVGSTPGMLTFNPYVSTFALDNLSFNRLAIPEPAALILLGTGLAALAALTKKRTKK